MFVKFIYVTESESTLHSEQDKQVNFPVILNMHFDVSCTFKLYFCKVTCLSDQ